MADRDVIIVGGGLAGSLAAAALAQRRSDVDFLLLERGETFGGNHVWSFFDSDIAPDDRAFLQPLVSRHWRDHEVRFPKRRRRLAIGYNSIRSSDLDARLKAILNPDSYRLGCKVRSFDADHVELASGERIRAKAVIDARGPTAMPGLDLRWQKFVGRTYRYTEPHGCPRPTIMDGTVAQRDGYRFLYELPFTPTELMLEDTYYADTPDLQRDRLGSELDEVARRYGANPNCVAEEFGVLPVVLGGSVSSLWDDDGPDVARLGLRGGFFHPTTGYSLPDAARNAALLARQRDFSSASLTTLFRRCADRLWTRRRFFRLLNRMLFDAAEPAHRYRVLEHFYRLPAPTVGRFYAARLTPLDKLRILSGRPPVPVTRAIASMAGR